MPAGDQPIDRKVPTDAEASDWANQVIVGLVRGTLVWKKFSRREWFLEGPCPRCQHHVSLPVGIIETVDIGTKPNPPAMDDATTKFVQTNGLHWDHAYLACNCQPGHKVSKDDEKPIPGCGFAEQHVVVVPIPDLGG